MTSYLQITSPAETTRYELQFNKKVEEHKSSGLWLSTAIGSTAAISAAGGQELAFDSQLSQYIVRELYKPKGYVEPRLVQGF